MFEFKHPKYYTELRKRNRDLSELQQVKLERSVPQSDQVISPRVATASARRSPGPGQELGEVQPCDREATPSSKRQASSTVDPDPTDPKPEPSSGSEAASSKHQATSNKHQA